MIHKRYTYICQYFINKKIAGILVKLNIVIVEEK